LQVGLVASPDVYTFEVTNTEHFIILGCDGLWGVCHFVSHRHSFTHFAGLNLLFLNEYDVLFMYQVFGPSDAVDFVQKLLNVRACYIFSYLAT